MTTHHDRPTLPYPSVHEALERAAAIATSLPPLVGLAYLARHASAFLADSAGSTLAPDSPAPYSALAALSLAESLPLTLGGE